MKLIGLIGGMSWESSAEYYRILNQGVRDRLGPTASARCPLWSFSFAEIEELQRRGDWPGLGIGFWAKRFERACVRKCFPGETFGRTCPERRTSVADSGPFTR